MTSALPSSPRPIAAWCSLAARCSRAPTCGTIASLATSAIARERAATVTRISAPSTLLSAVLGALFRCGYCDSPTAPDQCETLVLGSTLFAAVDGSRWGRSYTEPGNPPVRTPDAVGTQYYEHLGGGDTSLQGKLLPQLEQVICPPPSAVFEH